MNRLIPEIPIIYFHSIAPQQNPDWVRKGLTLELRYFEDFLEYLKRNRWETLFFDEYLHIRKSGEKPGKKVCCLSFDDGYLDNFIYAYPLLKKQGFKATIFVSPEFIDHKRSVSKTLEDVWNGSATSKEIDKWGFLTWEEMRIMQQSGVMDIHSHTMTHTKYFISDDIVTFHHPGDDCLIRSEMSLLKKSLITLLPANLKRGSPMELPSSRKHPQ